MMVQKSKWVFVIALDSNNGSRVYPQRVFADTLVGRKRLMESVMQLVYARDIKVAGEDMYGWQYLREAILDRDINAANNLMEGCTIEIFEYIYQKLEY